MTSISNSPHFFAYHKAQNLASPVILDDTLETAAAAGLHFSADSPAGLLAEQDLQAAFLSMSGYEKAQTPVEKEYDTSQPLQGPMYLAYAQPAGFASAHVNPVGPQYVRQTNHVPYEANAVLQPRASFDDSHVSFPESRPERYPQVTNFEPQNGPKGVQFFLHFQSSYHIASSQSWTYLIMFGSHLVHPELTRLDQHAQYLNYVLSTTVPPFSATEWNSSEVPIKMLIQDETGAEVKTLDVGRYTYTDFTHRVSQPSSYQSSRKRKMSADEGESSKVPMKRVSHQQLRSGLEATGEPIMYSQRSPVYLSAQRSVSGDVSYPQSPNLTAYSQQQREISPRKTSPRLPASSSTMYPQRAQLSPQTPSWSPSTALRNLPARSPNLPVATAARTSSISSLSKSLYPRLVRTSTLPQPLSPAATPLGAPESTSFNPYNRNLPHKAILKINGNLDSMADDWSDEEFAAKRRLVQFWRSQKDNTITTNFKPIAPDDRASPSICISCILWESKGDCYVTSVDTIYLLESLVAVRFTVEEKNRIRRNLEGFQPMTVSKGKADSEDFFKLIMGFPNPKPRNIEKDVKVFKWKTLTHALKKIIGKYSASYSSTAGEFSHHPATSQYGGVAQPGLGAREVSSTSPHPASVSSASAYSTTMLPAVLSPRNVSNSIAMAYSQGGPSIHQSPMAQSYSTTPQGVFNYTAQMTPQMTQSPATMQMMPQPQRGSWDFGNYLEHAPTASTPTNTNAQALYYHRDDPSVASSQDSAAAQYQMIHPSSGP